MTIDLVYFSDSKSNAVPDWSLGEVRVMPHHITNGIFMLDSLIRRSEAEFTLLWDFKFGEPQEELIKSLASGPIDIWHAGLRLGLQGQPSFLNYIYPTWMYNYDVDPALNSTSFRMSFRACLFRNKIWLLAGGADASFTSYEMIGLDLGYRWLKAGALIRYSSVLVQSEAAIEQLNLSLQDQFRFVRKYFPRKWVLWTLYRNLLKKFSSTIKAWWRSRNIKQVEILPLLNVNEKRKTEKGSVTVLIPTLGRYPYLINELEQLKKQILKPLEILITDQTDVIDRNSDFLAAYQDLNIRYFPQDTKGQCLAWNKLLEEAKGEYVLFLGDDADDIYPGFISDLLSTLKYFNADMVASHVEEVGITYSERSKGHIKISDVFPICLVRRSLLEQTGFMDMAFNRDIRADHDLAMRCHKKGALMIYDYSCRVLHHRAPSGGLRTHKARVKTRHQSKNSISTLVFPSTSEIYLTKKYFSADQAAEELRIRKLSLLFINGNALRQILRIITVILKYPAIIREIRKRVRLAEQLIHQK